MSRRAEQHPADASKSSLHHHHDDDDSSYAPSTNPDGGDGPGAAASSAAAREAAKERQTLARKETRAVKGLRIIVLLVICVTAIVVSIGVLLYTRNVERNDFERAFTGHANRVIESFHESVERTLAAMDALSVTYTSYARDTGATFPNVTLPDWEVRAANSRIQADGLFFWWLPLVTNESRAGWEAYANETYPHYMESYMREVSLRGAQDAKFNVTYPEQEQGQRRRLPIDPHVFRDQIWTIVSEEPGADEPVPQEWSPFLPIWQVSPVMPLLSSLNLNIRDFDATKGAIDHALATHKAVLALATNNRDPNEEDNEGDDLLNFYLANGQLRADPDTFMVDPTSPFFYPVFDNFDIVNNTREVVGFVETSIYWRLYLRDVLPPGANGIICVLDNHEQTPASYRIDGAKATYLGPGDKHDPSYTHLGKFADVSAYVESRQSVENRAYTAVDLDTEFVRYTLTIYPSATLEQSYQSRNPAVLTAVVALIFAFTSFVFILYDCLVERRQNIVMDKAVKSGALVSTLYPETVRDRLMEETVGLENKQQSKEDAGKNAWRSSTHSIAKSFTSTTMRTGESQRSKNGLDASTQSAGGPAENRGRPIADLYPNTTILFADIAGFTKWSAKRTPVEVFELLEALYSAFDLVATRRKVFKVETIGDCYVAVTGLPKPQADHAVRMVRFARDALIVKGTYVLSSLQSKLGEDTEELGFRIGIHSGPVTAGVLRGDKSRFQLFGDTMNTASRMESTGMKGRIHASQAVVDELTISGKGHWATPREDKVNPKGKGEMQTYWVNVTLPVKSTLTCSSVGVSVPDDVLDDDGFYAEDYMPVEAKEPPMSTLLVPSSPPLMDTPREVTVPPGPLGIVVEERSGLVICAIESTSVVHGLCSPGDVIVKFNDVDTTKSSAAELYILAADSVGQSKTLTLARQASLQNVVGGDETSIERHEVEV